MKKLPRWLIAEDPTDAESLSYLVRPREQPVVALVTQKRGCQLQLTVAAGQPNSPMWHRLMESGAAFWAACVNQQAYAQQPPEILIRDTFTPPKFLLCDNNRIDRVFIVHTAQPFVVAEIQDGQLVPVSGELTHPEASAVLAQAAQLPRI